MQKVIKELKFYVFITKLFFVVNVIIGAVALVVSAVFWQQWLYPTLYLIFAMTFCAFAYLLCETIKDMAEELYFNPDGKIDRS